MATIFWVSTDGDADSAASYSTGAIPVTGDTLIFDGIGSQRSVSSGLTTAFNGETLTLIWTKPAYTGDIGTVGSALVVASAKHLIQGSGFVHLNIGGGVPLTIMDAANGRMLLNTHTSTGIVLARRGELTIHGDGATFSMLIVTYYRDPANDVTVFVSASSNDINAVYQNGGYVECERELAVAGTSVNVFAGGVWVQQGSVGIEHAVVVGGHIQYDSTGTLGLVTGLAGVVDFTIAGGARTVTTLRAFPGFEYFKSAEVTITNEDDFRVPVP